MWRKTTDKAGKGHQKLSLKQHLTVSTALATAAAFGYGTRQAYAGFCFDTPLPGTYECRGPASSYDANYGFGVFRNPVSGNVGTITVTTTNGFSVDTTLGNYDAPAILVERAAGSVTFVDNYNSFIKGANSGIEILKVDGTGGRVSITTTGEVVSSAGTGLRARSSRTTIPTSDRSADGNDLIISAKDVSGSTNGIAAKQYTAGDISITSTGAITATENAGVLATLARSQSGTSYEPAPSETGTFDIRSIAIDVQDVTGGSHGILVNQDNLTVGVVYSGVGGIDITARGNVSGDIGIYAAGRSVGGPGQPGIKITAVDVTGNDTAIVAKQSGSAGLAITTTGHVSSIGGDGIVAETRYSIYAPSQNGTRIETASVTANDTGISVAVREGNIDIVSTGSIVGNAGTGPNQDPNRKADGIRAVRVVGDGSISIEAADVSGKDFGIYANVGDGDSLSITSTGSVTASQSTGIYAYKPLFAANRQAITVAAHDVSGPENGIVAKSENGAVDITVTGTIEGGTGAGIVTRGQQTTITLKDGASVGTTQAGSGVAISSSTEITFAQDAVSLLVVETGASINGQINLSGARDEIAFNGGDFSGVTRIDGGGGDDSLSFNGSSGTLDGAAVKNIERVSIGTQTRIDLVNTLISSELLVEDGGILTGNAGLTGNLTLNNNASLIIGASPGTFSVTGNAQFDTGSILFFELGGLTAGTEYDQLDIIGSADFGIGSTLNISSSNGFRASAGDTFDLILADSFNGRSTMDFFFSLAPDVLAPGASWRSVIADVGGRQVLRLEVAAVPLPAAGFLWLSSLAGFAGLRAMRKRGDRAKMLH
jgi:hypothetical protein